MTHQQIVIVVALSMSCVNRIPVTTSSAPGKPVEPARDHRLDDAPGPAELRG
jgi:hypothetical protein